MPSGTKQQSMSKPTFDFEAANQTTREVNTINLNGNTADHLDMHISTAPFNKRPRGISINLFDQLNKTDNGGSVASVNYPSFKRAKQLSIMRNSVQIPDIEKVSELFS